MPVQVQCPNPACGKASKVPDGYLGHTVRCPVCREKFKLSADGVPQPAGTSSIAPASANQTHVPASNTFGPAPRAASLTAQPAHIGRFDIRARLGSGAFGTVYRAHDPQLEREVALKVPQPGTLDNPQAVERFLREAKSAARLRHPNIVPVYDAGQDGDLYYIASAFIEGRTLARAVTEGGLDERQAAQIVRHLAEALAYAHRQGIVHRDVKPANVMLDAKGTPHLMDFGLAHQQDAAQKLTQDGALLGTPAYMAPEMAQGQSGDPQPVSDQYSLGVVLYELLTAQTPFSGPPQIVLFNAIHREPPAPRSLKPGLALDLETICLKAMAKRPEERYANCQEMADDLRRWLDGEPIQARRMGLAERVGRWVRREPKVAGLMAAVMFVLVTGIAVSMYFAALADLKATEAQAGAEQSRQEQERAQLAENRANQKAAEVEDKNNLLDEALARTEATREELQAEVQKRRKSENELQVAYDKLKKESEEADKARREAKEAQGITDKVTQEAERERRRREHISLTKLTQKPFSNVLFHPDGKRVTFATQKEVRLWDIEQTKSELLASHNNMAVSLSISSDGRLLAFAGHEYSISIYDFMTRSYRKSITQLTRVLAFCPDSNDLFFGHPKGIGSVPGLLGIKEDSRKWKDELEGAKVDSLAVSHDGTLLAVGATDQFSKYPKGHQSVRIFGIDKPGKRDLWSLSPDAINNDKPTQVVGLAFKPGKNEHLAMVRHQVEVWSWGFVTQRDQRLFRVPGQRMVIYSPDGNRLATINQNEILLYDSSTAKVLRRIRGHTLPVTSIAFSPDGNRIVSLSEDMTARVWDVSPDLDEPDKPEAPAEKKP